MQVPSTQQAIERFDDNDSFLHACLGLVALVPQFDGLLASLLGPADTAPEGIPAHDPVLDVALGVIALRLQVGMQLDHLAQDPTPHLHVEFAPDAGQGLLR